MDSITLDFGKKKIAINNDPNNCIEFDPRDVTFAEAFYALVGDFQAKLNEFEARSTELSKNTELDSNGMPVNFGEQLKLVRTSCEYFREKIDQLFGPDVSKRIFGDSLNIEVYGQFFDGILPFIQKARSEKLAKHITEKSSVLK